MDQNAQSRAVSIVKEYWTDYDVKTRKRKGQLKDIYDETMDYFPVKEQDWDSNLKVNFMNQREHMIASKITAKNPKVMVSIRQNPIEIAEEYAPGADDETLDMMYRNIMNQWAPAIQAYFAMWFDNARVKSAIRRAAKMLVRNGNLYGTVSYRYDLMREKEKKGDDYKITEKVVEEYPEIQLISPQELYFDPRYIFMEDMPAVIWRHEKVRLSQLKAMEGKEGMMNLDKIKYAKEGDYNYDKGQIYRIMTTDTYGSTTEEACSTLTVDKYFGYFSPDGNWENEVMYELWVVNSSVLVRARPITKNPVKSCACFEDGEQHFGTGIAEAMIGLQKEYNFKMNSAIEYINSNLNHTYLWDSNSGINPEMLMYANAPKAIIPVSKGMEAAINGFTEIPRRPIDQSYFSNQNEIRGDMETVSFSVNALNSGVRPGSSETATGIKATYYDSNLVMQGLLRQFEEWLAEICYDVLDALVENFEGDKIVTAIGKNKYEWANKEIFRKSKLRYLIKIDIGSSSFDSAENRREDALAKVTILKGMKEDGLNPNMKTAYEDVLSTFEGVVPERYLGSEDPTEQIAKQVSGGAMPKLPGMPGLPGTQDMGTFGDMLNAPPTMSPEMSQDVVGNIIPQ